MVRGSRFSAFAFAFSVSFFEAAELAALAFVGRAGTPRAEERPCQFRDLAGFDLFLGQGIHAFEIFTGYVLASSVLQDLEARLRVLERERTF